MQKIASEIAAAEALLRTLQAALAALNQWVASLLRSLIDGI